MGLCVCNLLRCMPLASAARSLTVNSSPSCFTRLCETQSPDADAVLQHAIHRAPAPVHHTDHLDKVRHSCCKFEMMVCCFLIAG